MVSSTPWPHFTPRKDPVPILQEAGWAPGPVWNGGKSRLHRDSIPNCPARSQSLYRLSYRAHRVSKRRETQLKKEGNEESTRKKEVERGSKKKKVKKKSINKELKEETQKLRKNRTAERKRMKPTKMKKYDL